MENATVLMSLAQLVIFRGPDKPLEFTECPRLDAMKVKHW
jgi:hypothetical protein